MSLLEIGGVAGVAQNLALHGNAANHATRATQGSQTTAAQMRRQRAQAAGDGAFVAAQGFADLLQRLVFFFTQAIDFAIASVWGNAGQAVAFNATLSVHADVFDHSTVARHCEKLPGMGAAVNADG